MRHSIETTPLMHSSIGTTPLTRHTSHILFSAHNWYHTIALLSYHTKPYDIILYHTDRHYPLICTKCWNHLAVNSKDVSRYADPPHPPPLHLRVSIPPSLSQARTSGKGGHCLAAGLPSISDVTSFKDIVIKRDAKIHILWNFIGKDIALVFYFIGKDVLLSWLLNNTNPNFQTHVGSICRRRTAQPTSYYLIINFRKEEPLCTINLSPLHFCVFFSNFWTVSIEPRLFIRIRFYWIVHAALTVILFGDLKQRLINNKTQLLSKLASAHCLLCPYVNRQC